MLWPISPSLPTKISPAKIRRLKTSGKHSTDMRIPPLKMKVLLESDPLKSRILVRRSVVPLHGAGPVAAETGELMRQPRQAASLPGRS